jgi:Uma2 family endonuclease
MSDLMLPEMFNSSAPASDTIASMAAVPNPPLVAVDEYLNSSYRPDMEYVDGVLVERGMPTIAHSLLQRVLIRHFAQHESRLRFLTLPEVRTQIVERAKYRIPDVMLCPVPLPTGKVVTSVPWAVIEILSPDDKLPEQLERFRDYQRIGVRQVVLLDPENLIAFRFEDGSLLQTRFTSLDLPSGSVPFDTEALFQELTTLRNQGM